jgi:hypothetical protein
MVDVGTGLTALGTAEVTKDMIGKMLGPTAEYIGGGVREWTERRTQNVQAVFARASRRLGAELERPGSVPPRVLKVVLDEAQVADDELLAEYLGGILASSRTESGRDDRAASMARLVSGLSTYAIRSHYLFYVSAHRLLLGTDPSELRMSRGADRHVYVPIADYAAAMEFSTSEEDAFFGILSDTLLALNRNNLLASWVSGDPDTLRSTTNKDYPSEGLIFEPTQQGIALFCFANGVSADPYSAFVDSDVSLVIEDAPELSNAVLARDLPDYSGPSGPEIALQ